MVISAMLLCSVGAMVPVLNLKDAEIGQLSQRLKAETRRPLTVRLSGVVELKEPIVLGPEASQVTFTGKAILSGGTTLKSWKKVGNIWTQPLGFQASSLRQLFVNGERWGRPTLPGGGKFYQFADYASPAEASGEWNKGQNRMIYAPGDLNPNWLNRDEVEVMAHHLWVTSRMRIKEMDTAARLVTFDRPSVFKLSNDYDGKAAVYRVINVREALDQPKTYFWDRKANEIQTQTPMKAAVAPRLAEILRIQGAKDVVFRWLNFSHTEYDLPGSAGDFQAGHTVPASVTLVDCERVRFENCGFTRLGNWGLEIIGKSTSNAVKDCTFDDLGAGGIKLGNGTSGTTIDSNSITRGGRIFPSACGIWGGLTGHNTIQYNRIHDFYYTGISLGWDWGFRDTEAKENLIAGNDISLIGQGELSDMGGIYVLGKQPGSVIRNNRIQQVFARGYGGWGIYLDEGSTGWTVLNNLVVDTKTGGFHIHYGGNNVIRNNIFIGSRSDAQLIRVRDDQQGPITFEGNVVVSRDAAVPIVGPGWLKRDVSLRNNVFWTPAADRSLPFGADATNKYADPKLDTNNIPQISGWSGFDLKQVGPRKR
ncbi:MAG: right-handed parallel beta-helix repeat-containing protein [Fimbriimonas sp.]